MVHNYLKLRKLATYVVAALLLLVCNGSAKAQTTLAAGDITIVTYNVGGTSATNFIEFVTWVPLTDNTVIKFTNDGWYGAAYSANANATGAARPSNQITVWKNTTGSTIAAGTVIRFSQDGTTLSHGSLSFIANTCACGSVSSAFMSMVSTGARVFVYQGSGSNPIAGSNTTDYSASGTAAANFFGTVLYGIGLQGSSSTHTGWLTTSGTAGAVLTYIPSDITSSTRNIFFAGNTRSAIYSGPRTGNTVASYKAAISNQANWTTSTSGAVSNNNTSFALASSPSVTVTSQTHVACNGGSTGSATVSVSGGTAPFTYSWAPSGGTAATATGLAAGSYTCTVTDATSATATATATITQPSAVSASASNGGAVCEGTTLSLTGSASGGTGGYTYSWNGPGGSFTSAIASPTISSVTATAAGIYTLTVTDANGCTATATTTTTINLLPNAGTIITANSTGVASVCMTAFVAHNNGGGATGGTWSSSNTAVGTINPSTGTLGGASYGTTTISYVVSNSCGTSVATKVFTVYALSDTGTISGTLALCAGGTTTLNSSSTSPISFGPFNRVWSSSATSIATVSGSGTTTGVVSGVAAGTARITFTITGCGTFRAYRIVTVSPLPTVPAIGGPTSVAAGSTITLTNGTSGGTWTSGTPSLATVDASTGVVTGASAGTALISYQVTNSCGTTTVTTNVTVTSSFAASLTSQTNVACNGGNTGAAMVSVTGGITPYSYSWAPSGGTAATATGLAAGTYTCTVTDAASATATATVTITQPSALTSSGTYTATSCNGGSNGRATVSVSGGTPSYTYSWAPSGGTSALATGLAAGNYTCTVTDANACVKTQTVTVTQPSAVTTSTAVTTVACNGGSNGVAAVSASGGTSPYFYSWAPSGGTSSVATGLVAGSYTVTVTDNNSCTTTRTVIVTQPSALTSTGTYTATSCNGGSNGRASVSVSGGAGGYAYSWAPSGGTSALATGLAAGNYTCTVTDANSCQKTQTVTVTQPAAITTATSVVTVSCNGMLNGQAAVSVSGGTAPYSYSWAPFGGTSSVATDLAAGSYTVTVTDNNSCTVTRFATITQPSALTSSGSSTSVSCFGGSNGTATVSVSGGAGGYIYSWAPSGGSAATATGLAAGTYTCTVEDANGCQKTQTVTVTQPSTPVSGTTVVTNVACNGNNTGVINLTPTGGSSPYTYLWNSGATTEDRTGLTAGNYSVTITDANGCTGTVSATVTQPSALSVSAGVTNPACFGLSNGSATVSVSGGTPSYEYSWAPSGGTNATASGLSAGTYTCTITDANSCTTTQSVTIEDPAPMIITGFGSNSPLCEGLTLNFSGSVVGAVGTVNYNWQGPDSFTSSVVNPSISFVTPSAVGTYTMFATDSNGCTAQASTEVVVYPLPVAGVILGDSTLNLSATTTLTATVEGGTWSASNSHATVSSTGVVTGVSLGTVTISYSVSNDCGTAVATKIINVSGAAVSGTQIICMGATTTLTGTPSGGTWASGNIPLALVNASGVVTGLSTGTVNISYTVGGSTTITVITINTTPSVFTGSYSICYAGTSTLGTTPSGGTWTSSDPTVAEITSTGILSGLSLGNSVISYTLSNGCARSVVATVNNMPAEISGFTTTCVGGSTTLSNSVPGGVFSSGNSSIATCTMGGAVTGVAPGSVLISYSMGGCHVTTLVSVTAAPAITGTAAACVGATTSLSNALTGGVWSSGNGSVAEVDPSGLVLGVSGGTATISYTLSSGCARTRVVTINATPVVNGPSTICVGGGSVNLTSAPATTSWINSTPSVATITGSGLLTAVSAGSTTISVVSAAGCTNSAVINVTSLPTIIGTLTACMSGTTSLSGSVTGGTWSSSSTGVASVNSSTGLVTGANLGTTTISYSIGAGCLRTGVLTVTGLPAISGTPVMCVGGSVALAGSPSGGSWSTADPLTATVSGTGVVTGQASGNTNIIYTNATTGCSRSVIATINATPGAFTGTTNICVGTTSSLSNATPGGTWSSSNPAFASAAVATGVITGAGAGVATITYRVGTCSATTPFTVRALPNNITGGMQTVVGATTTLNNTTPGGTWSSSNPAAGTISATGVVTGIASGTSSVVYTASNGCTKSVVVTINAAPALPGPRNVCVGTTITISSPTIGVSSWSSSDLTKATVNVGIVTGIAPGTATITYVLTAGGYATTEVTVLPLPAVITGTPSVCVGLVTSLASATSGGAWTCSNSSLATINTSGVVTGINNGVGTISYTLPTGCRRTVNVTVNQLPSPITGLSSVCVGATMYPYLASPSSGTWSSSDITIATVPATHGAVAGVAAGTALISLTNPAGCSISKEITVVVCPSRGMLTGTTSVTNLNNGDLNISLYPNPTNGTFSVNTPEAGKMSISTIDGREVMNREVGAGITEMTLPSALTTGVYMCRFTGNNGAVTSVRLILE